MANEWERFLSAYGEASKSTPHLYLSALSWIPANSHLRHIARGIFPSKPPTISNIPKTWSNERWSEDVGIDVNSVAYSADGCLFAVGCLDGSIRLWEARSREVAREPFETGCEVNSIAFSPDTRWLASGHSDGNIRLWDLCAESTVPRLLEGHTDKVESVAFSSDGKRIVSGPDGE